MTDLDTKLRVLANALTADAPSPPSINDLRVPVEPVEIARQRRPSRGLVAVVVIMMIVAIIGVVAIERLHDPSSPASGEVCLPDPGSFVGARGNTFGPLMRSVESPGRAVFDDVPDFVRVACVGSDGIIGWVRASDLLPQLIGPPPESLSSPGPNSTPMCNKAGTEAATLETSPRYPVFRDDGVTVIGHIYPTVGFVARGEAMPRAYPDRNGLRPCDGEVTALPTHPAASSAELAWPNAVNDEVYYDNVRGIRSPDPNFTQPVFFHGDGRTYSMAFADQVREHAAQSAKVKGEPYNPADLIPPLRDRAGRIVGYGALNAGRLLTVEEVNDPDFDLCAVQVENAVRQQRQLKRHPERLPTSFTEEQRQSLLNRDPRESVGC